MFTLPDAEGWFYKGIYHRYGAIHQIGGNVKNKVIAVVLIVAAGFFGWRYLMGTSSAPEPGTGRDTARAVPVEVTPIKRGSIRDVAQFTGSLRASARFVISPKIQGRLEELRVDIGDHVENGMLIAVLDGEEYILAVTQAEAELEVSRANLQDAKSALEIAARELERVQELQQERVASEAELDTAQAKHSAARAAHEVAKAQIQQREAALEAARVRLSYTRIHARWSDGPEKRIVSEKHIDEGNMLRANDPIVAIVDIDSVIAQINVIERDFPEIRIGQSALITADAYPDRTFEGRVVRRAPILAEETRQAMVEIRIPNTDLALAPGMYVRARIEFSRKEDATIIPASSIVNRDDQKGIFIADEETETASFLPVETGITEGEIVEITHPVAEGMVVTLGQHLLEDGAAVRIVGTITELEN